MKLPERIPPLIEEWLGDAVLRQLMSGKEGTIHGVRLRSRESLR
jgi:hypothetical protein